MARDCRAWGPPRSCLYVAWCLVEPGERLGVPCHARGGDGAGVGPVGARAERPCCRPAPHKGDRRASWQTLGTGLARGGLRWLLPGSKGAGGFQPLPPVMPPPSCPKPGWASLSLWAGSKAMLPAPGSCSRFGRRRPHSWHSRGGRGICGGAMGPAGGKSIAGSVTGADFPIQGLISPFTGEEQGLAGGCSPRPAWAALPLPLRTLHKSPGGCVRGSAGSWWKWPCPMAAPRRATTIPSPTPGMGLGAAWP